MGQFGKSLSQRRFSLVMALRCALLLVLVLASVGFVSADGDAFSGKDCISDSQCMTPISFCDNSKQGTVGAAVASKVSNTVAKLAGECAVVAWFGPLIAIIIITVVSSIFCSCLCCAFCPLYHLGKCLRPSEA